MKKSLNFTCLLTLLALAGCQKDIQQSKEQNASAESASVAKPSSTGNSTVYLSVTVDDASGNQVQSDGKGVHGQRH